MPIESQEALIRHQSWIISWLVGYRTGRSKNPATPGLPQGLGWLEVARMCREFMREQHRVYCTIGEVLMTFDEYLVDRGRDRIDKRVLDHAESYEKFKPPPPMPQGGGGFELMS